MIKCLVIDDEPLAQEIIERYILQTDNLELIKKCSNVIEAFAILEKQPIDLLFLDIKMPVINGIDFIRSLTHPPAVIFTTAFSEYAVDSYDIEAVDYLLKPITFTRFKKSIEKYVKQNNNTGSLQPSYLYIKMDGRLVKIFHADILYIESMRDYMKIVTKKGNYITHLTLKALTDLLPSGQFLRIHRSFIVHTKHISAISRNEIFVNDIKIPIGENYRDNIRSIDKNIPNN